MRVKEQFNKYASCYHSNSIIQSKGVELLVETLPNNLGRTIDLGCGSGRLFKELHKKSKSFELFCGVDFAESMLSLHPKSENVSLLTADFNKKESFERLRELKAQTLLSASALQWAKDIDFTFAESATLAPYGAFFLFCSGTFKGLHECAGVSSPIHSCEKIETAFKRYYKVERVQRYNFTLPFERPLDMLRYIKQSGVSGNLQLSYTQIKQILETYPHKYLEFETILLTGESKCLQ
jgi:malonyl-CoA O-methyltransferase